MPCAARQEMSRTLGLPASRPLGRSGPPGHLEAQRSGSSRSLLAGQLPGHTLSEAAGRTSLPGQGPGTQHRGAHTLHGLGFAPAQLLVCAELFNGNTNPHLPPSFILAKGSETSRCREV